MIFFNKTERKNWKKKVREETERATSSFLTKVFAKFGIYDASERFLVWADKHRKLMFGITVSFLLFVVGFSFYIRPQKDIIQENRNRLVQIREESGNLDGLKNREQMLRETIDLMRLKVRLEEAKAKGYLTQEDSLLIKQYYKKLKSLDQNETN